MAPLKRLRAVAPGVPPPALSGGEKGSAALPARPQRGLVFSGREGNRPKKRECRSPAAHSFSAGPVSIAGSIREAAR